MPTIHRDEYFLVQHHRASAHVRIIRSTAPFESLTAAVRALSACGDSLASMAVSDHGILFDWRQSPISTDPNLHKVLAERLDAMGEFFARRAILLATTVGTMQAARVGRTLGNQRMSVFDDEAAAVEYVTQR